MPAGDIRVAYAYEVAPRQMTTFAGGMLSTTNRIQAALDAAFDRSKIVAAPVVSFNVTTTPPIRQHPIRDAALQVAFGQGSSNDIAERLRESVINAVPGQPIRRYVGEVMEIDRPAVGVIVQNLRDDTTAFAVLNRDGTQISAAHLELMELGSRVYWTVYRRYLDQQYYNVSRVTLDIPPGVESDDIGGFGEQSSR